MTTPPPLPARTGQRDPPPPKSSHTSWSRLRCRLGLHDWHIYGEGKWHKAGRCLDCDIERTWRW